MKTRYPPRIYPTKYKLHSAAIAIAIDIDVVLMRDYVYTCVRARDNERPAPNWNSVNDAAVRSVVPFWERETESESESTCACVRVCVRLFQFAGGEGEEEDLLRKTGEAELYACDAKRHVKFRDWISFADYCSFFALHFCRFFVEVTDGEMTGFGIG